MFDSGAATCSLPSSEQKTLRVRNTSCTPMQVGVASGQIGVFGKLTVLSGSLVGDEGHVLRIPIVFLDDAPMNLIGRAGIMEVYSVLASPATKLTTFEWVGPQAWNPPVAWAQGMDTQWLAEIAAGRHWDAWTAAGRPWPWAPTP
jgi:hypothetical protein